MNIRLFVLLLMLFTSIDISVSQTVDLTSADQFFEVTSTLREGKNISAKQWNDFDNSSGYRRFAERENRFLINTIKSSINIAFGNGTKAEKDSILSISEEEMFKDKKLLLKKLILVNYLDVNDNYDSLKSFRENYDFNALIDNAKQRLSSFLNRPIDSTVKFKPVYFLFINAGGGNGEESIDVDFNLVYKMTEEERVNFLAHEFFHNYRESFENHEFNYKCDLNYTIDMIPNEGIADMIDKAEGYEKYYTDVLDLPGMIDLYNHAEEDLEKFHDLILKYSENKISETETVDGIIEIVKFNGHPIGFFMANHIASAGYKDEMIKEFYNPYKFYSLYNKAAKEQNLFRLSDEFMAYIRSLTKDYYR